MSHLIRQRSTRRRGIAAVEAALVLPVLVFFLAAIVDLGRLGKICDSVSTAARNGAQYGSASTAAAADATRIRAAALTEMANLPNVNGTNPTVTATTVTNSGKQFVQVTVTYDLTGTSVFSFYPVSRVTRTVQMPMMP
jgi:Flp pilus assembly protein TadG